MRKNVYGRALQICCSSPKTGYFRDGYCQSVAQDIGQHVVCAQVNSAFLAYTQKVGNDLLTPRPEWDFPGLKPGDRWCLCARRWLDAYENDAAAPVILEACDEAVLEMIPLAILEKFAIAGSH